MHTRTRLHMPNLNEARFESQYVRVRQCKRLRLPFPGNLPVLPGSPAVSVDEEGEVGVVEEELAVEPLDVDGLGVLFSCHKVEGCVGLVKELLSLKCFQADNFEAPSTSDAELRLEEVDGGGLGRDVEFLGRKSANNV